jgi:hypothetical protein
MKRIIIIATLTTDEDVVNIPYDEDRQNRATRQGWSKG